MERILGLTTFKPTALASAPSADLIAYAAGSVVVLYNHKKNKQVGFLYASSSSSPSHNLAPNNRHTIAGDALANPLSSLGVLDPNVPNSNTKKNPASNRAKAISCLTFSPDGAYLIVGEVKLLSPICSETLHSTARVNVFFFFFFRVVINHAF